MVKCFLLRGLIFFFCCLISSVGYAQQRNFDDLLGVSFPNAKEGWVCGRWGVVLHTADEGITWVRQNSGTDYSLTSISFVDAKNGWAVGDEGTIIHTEDGGTTWIKQKSPVPYYLMGVRFVSPMKGWIVTERTHILHTENGGKTWKVQFHDQDYILKSVSFANSQVGWTVGEYGFTYHTRDGGKTWKQQAGFYGISAETDEIEGGNFLFSVTAVSPQIAWAVGIDGHVTKTADGGKTWEKVSTKAPRTQLFCVAADKGGTIAIGGKGTFLVSKDDGKTWHFPRFDPSQTYGWLYGVASRGSLGFVAVGKDGFIYRADGSKIVTLWRQTVNK